MTVGWARPSWSASCSAQGWPPCGYASGARSRPDRPAAGRRRRAVGHRVHHHPVHRRPRFHRRPPGRPGAGRRPRGLGAGHAAGLGAVPAGRSPPPVRHLRPAGAARPPVDPAPTGTGRRAAHPRRVRRLRVPVCGWAIGAVDELRERFGGRLRYVFRHVPLSTSTPTRSWPPRPRRPPPAQARFWDMHDRLFGLEGRSTAYHCLDSDL